MVQTVSNTGAPVVELGVWVYQQNNEAYTALMNEHSAALTAGTQPAPSSAFDAMVNAFLAATNQSITA